MCALIQETHHITKGEFSVSLENILLYFVSKVLSSSTLFPFKANEEMMK